MRRDEWTRLAAPFPVTALDWCVAQLDREGGAARLEPVLSEEAVVERLDRVLGVEGWSKRLLPLGSDAVVCELELLGVRKSASARSFGDLIDMTRVCGWALARAAGLAGLRPPASEGAWVDFDVDSGEPITVPEVGHEARPAGADEAGGEGVTRAGPEGPSEDVAAAVEAAGSLLPSGDARSEGQQAIERLVDRLRAVGLGREAAGLVVEHGGYGRSPEDARELYRKLRELLLAKGTIS